MLKRGLRAFPLPPSSTVGLNLSGKLIARTVHTVSTSLKMGETYVNFFGGSPLNRLSWLRPSATFLNSIIASPETRWLVLKGGLPLLTTGPKRSIARLSTADVRPLLGAEPFFGQGERDGQSAPDDVSVLEAARLRHARVVFLGLHEPGGSTIGTLPSSDFTNKEESPETVVSRIKGTAYFSVDVTDIDQATVTSVLQNAQATKAGTTMEFSDARSAMGDFDGFQGALLAETLTMTDWNARNRFCPGCGSPLYSLWAGWKLTCSSLLPWADNTGRTPCPSGKGLHNYSHPRTDAVVIMFAIDKSGEKILLGRNKRFPAGLYSALTGFIEPGESFEDAVKREMREEAGVTVWDVKYHSTQPWPYPANLMVGFYATADASQPIRTDLDNELEDARWYTREEILYVLAHPEGTSFTRSDHQKMAAAAQEEKARNENGVVQQQAPAVNGSVPLKFPPFTAIATVLISEWAHGRITNV
ncbi:hypothetical protein JAAARDRAFT_328204 [Jaapia argillacea MUCL 33604]|uniref:NAD(+) diphosphatase n=1 Tax=Jaapia argillacea MUCL 33604 TaxID=933084 RepID=A0A067PLN4_9AGAM|nr:hypothetical protein JAAARDRAFT_328204 [Jaapia argillacea MUCL 33604]